MSIKWWSSQLLHSIHLVQVVEPELSLEEVKQFETVRMTKVLCHGGEWLWKEGLMEETHGFSWFLARDCGSLLMGMGSFKMMGTLAEGTGLPCFSDTPPHFALLMKQWSNKSHSNWPLRDSLPLRSEGKVDSGSLDGERRWFKRASFMELSVSLQFSMEGNSHNCFPQLVLSWFTPMITTQTSQCTVQ